MPPTRQAHPSACRLTTPRRYRSGVRRIASPSLTRSQKRFTCPSIHVIANASAISSPATTNASSRPWPAKNDHSNAPR